VTAQSRSIFNLVCDGCGIGHIDPEHDTTTLDIRISAGINGWAYRKRPGGHLIRQRYEHVDYCPSCAAEPDPEPDGAGRPDPAGKAAAP